MAANRSSANVNSWICFSVFAERQALWFVKVTLVITPSGAGAEIFRENKVDSMAVDELDPYVDRSSTATVFTVQDQWVFSFHEEGLRLILLSQSRDINKLKDRLNIFPKPTQCVNGFTCMMKSMKSTNAM